MSPADTPEPPPRTGTGDVWLEVIAACDRLPGFKNRAGYLAWYEAHKRGPGVGMTPEEATAIMARIPPGLRADMVRRRAYGLRVHKMPLQRDNERRHWVDCYQEALDLVAYAWAARAPWWLRWGAVLFAYLIRRRLPPT